MLVHKHIYTCTTNTSILTLMHIYVQTYTIHMKAYTPFFNKYTIHTSEHMHQDKNTYDHTHLHTYL